MSLHWLNGYLSQLRRGGNRRMAESEGRAESVVSNEAPPVVMMTGMCN